MTIIASIDHLISRLEAFKTVAVAEDVGSNSTAFDTFLSEASQNIDELAANETTQDDPYDLVDGFQSDIGANLASLQRSIRDSYSVTKAPDGRFTVTYPNGGVVGTYDTEAKAERMATVLEAGKASMIHSANVSIERDPIAEEELRGLGFSALQIEAAYEKQYENRQNARTILTRMLETEAGKSQSGLSLENIASFYRARISG